MTTDRVHVEVAPSALQAFVTVEAGEPIEADRATAAVREALTGAGVIVGLDPFVVTQLADGLTSPTFELGRTRVAAAEPPVPGRVGLLTTSFDLGIQPGLVRDDGTVDYRDRSLLRPVRSGDVIADYRPPVAGRDGRGVDGSTLSAAGSGDPSLHLGPGVELDSASQVVAVQDGVVKWDGALGLDVVAQFRHEGDVDLASGHLRMEGDLVVAGTVQDGFGVRASGDVEIMGDVDGGTVVAGGDVVVTGVIIGESALVSAQGSVLARRIQNGVVRARGRVEFQVDAIEASASGAEVFVAGVVRGGRTEAETSVQVKDAGGAAVGAWLSAGTPTEWPDDAARAMARLAKSTRGSSRSGGRRSRGGSKIRADGASRAGAAVRQAQLRARRRAALRLAHVDVSGTAAAGVTVQMGDRRQTLTDSRRHVRFRFDPSEDEIVSEDLP